MSRLIGSEKRGAAVVGCLLIACAPLMLAQGCPLTGGETPTVTVSGPASSQTVTAGSTVSVIYTVQGTGALDIRAFYDRDGVAGTGDEVVFATGLAGGQNQTTTWNTAAVPGGAYRVGVVATSAGGVAAAYAPGIVTLREALTISFSAPTVDLFGNPGRLISIGFAAGATGPYSYNLFYDSDTLVNGNEITIAVGTGTGGAVVSQTWNTVGVPPATYNIGVTVRETSGQARQGTKYADAQVTLTGGAFVYVVQPATNIDVSQGDLLDILFAAGEPAGGTSTVEVFYDINDNYQGDGSETTIEAGMPLDRTTTTWDTSVISDGVYFIGALLRPGPGAAPTAIAYAPGRVTVGLGGGDGGDGGGGTGGSGAITVTTPSTDQTVIQGLTFTIRWLTTTTSAEGSVTLYRDADANGDRRPDGAPIQIAAGLDPATKSYDWNTSGAVGTFFIIAKLTKTDGTVPEDSSSGRLTIRSPYVWIGEVGTQTVPGAAIRGFNFQDHAGTGFAKVEDADGDGINDIVVLSQYGKPNLTNPQGAGTGEAYLIFGNSGGRLNGTFNLNQTGAVPRIATEPRSTTDGLDQGIVFVGLAMAAGDTDTTGITCALAAPDMDGDGNDELVFGIPRANNVSLWSQTYSQGWDGLLENDGQFLRGGIIIVSSDNSLFRSRSAVGDDGDRVIRLQEVGQRWVRHDLGGVRGDCSQADPPGPCTAIPDLQQYHRDTSDNGECDAFDYDPWRKGFTQPIAGSPFSIDPPLADLADVQAMLLECALETVQPDGDPPPAPIPPDPPVVTGMYNAFQRDPVTGRMLDGAREPYGARILGLGLEDGTPPDSRFGFQVAAIRAANGPQFLLISSPNTTATVADVPQLPADRTNSGLVYELRTTNYWDMTDIYDAPTNNARTPRPRQYIIRRAGSFTGYVAPVGSGYDYIRRPFSIVGPSSNSRISNVTAIGDFNGDVLEDFMVGVPAENAGEGSVFLVFRRLFEIEGNYLLDNLALAADAPQRLNGVLIRGESGDAMGEVLSRGGDFNGDKRADALIGLPNHRGGRGGALIVFGSSQLLSPAGGYQIDALVAAGKAALLVGTNPGDLAGFNVASAGDVDGDGKEDLLIAAPGASPRFDSDGDGVPDTIGLDRNGDRVADDLNGDGSADDLTAAGLVYVVLGKNVLQGEISLSSIGTSALKGMVFVGREAGNALGGGVNNSIGLGVRSRGLSGAGDMDKDGKNDILIGAPLADPGGVTNAGEAYLVYGGFQLLREASR